MPLEQLTHNAVIIIDITIRCGNKSHYSPINYDYHGLQ